MKTLKPLIHIGLLLLAGLAPALAADELPEERFSQADLDHLLAPIALYPDVLLAQVLMAATYPLEVVEAARWSRAHPDLEGEEAVRAADAQEWDDSVKALLAFPDLIQLMDENLGWTRRIGDAFLLQQEQVMETAQALRQRALEQGSLDNLEHAAIERVGGQILIVPRQVEYVYVPYYSTRVVYGDWWWYDYPPYFWRSPSVYYTRTGFYWSSGFRVSTGFYYSSFDWTRRSVVRHSDFWRHDPRHRRGVDYRSRTLNERYGRSPASSIHTRVRAPRPPARPEPSDRSYRTERRVLPERFVRGGDRPPVAVRPQPPGRPGETPPARPRETPPARPKETPPPGMVNPPKADPGNSSVSDRSPPAAPPRRIAEYPRGSRNPQIHAGRTRDP
jgi:hypothetical protein